MKQINKPGAFVAGRLCASLFVVVLILLAASMPAAVQAAPVTIQSDHLDIWENKQQALFTGSVHLVREDFELFCDTLRAFYRSGKEGGGIDHALANGHVRMIQGDKQGTADSAVIDNRKQRVTLRGNAVMVQEGGRVAGETIVHDIAAKTTEVMQGENGRVTLRIDEKQMDDGGVQAKGGEKVPAQVVVGVPVEDGEKPAPGVNGQEQQP